MKYKLIDTSKAMMPVDRMCRMMAVSISGYYAWKERRPSLHQCYDVVLSANIRAQFASSNQTYGAPRMHAELREEGLVVGRHRVARLMRENGLKAHQKRRFKKTTDSQHDCPIAFNILDQNFVCEGPDQKWGADIYRRSFASRLAIFGPLKAGSIWPSCLISTRDALSVGQQVIA